MTRARKLLSARLDFVTPFPSTQGPSGRRLPTAANPGTIVARSPPCDAPVIRLFEHLGDTRSLRPALVGVVAADETARFADGTGQDRSLAMCTPCAPQRSGGSPTIPVGGAPGEARKLPIQTLCPLGDARERGNVSNGDHIQGRAESGMMFAHRPFHGCPAWRLRAPQRANTLHATSKARVFLASRISWFGCNP
jgi:hypothetical protein